MMTVGTHEIGGPVRRAGKGRAEDIDIGSGSWVGARALVIAGSGVGAGCVVAAGAVVTERYGDNALIGGVPARVIRQLEEDDEAPVVRVSR